MIQTIEPSDSTPPTAPPGTVVQLRRATLPSLLRWIAVHYWFAAYSPDAQPEAVPGQGGWRRWEVWQTRDAGGTSWGHVHRDLMHPDRPVGGGPCCIEAEWGGAEAERLFRALERSPEYPRREEYAYWPGPNSNTYAAWVLREAGVHHDLDPRAVGKDYLGPLGGRARRAEGGVQIETPLLGVKIGPDCGFELHLLSLTLGYTGRLPALKTPFGRLRLPRP